MSEVGDAVAHHGEPVGAHTEGEPGDLIRVISNCLEDRRIDHSATQELHPPSICVDVHLGGGFGEREEVRDELDLRFGSKELVGKVSQDTLQVTECDIGVDGQPLDLMKDGRVRRVLVAGSRSQRRETILELYKQYKEITKNVKINIGHDDSEVYGGF